MQAIINIINYNTLAMRWAEEQLIRGYDDFVNALDGYVKRHMTQHLRKRLEANFQNKSLRPRA